MTDSRNQPAGAADPDAVARFVERLALTMVDSGLQRMPSRVFAALLVSEDGKLTAGELAETLQVSPAAISGAVRYLTQVGLIHRARDPGERRDHYEVSEDIWFEAYANRDKQLENWANVLGEGVELVGRHTKAGARIAMSERFFRFLQGELPNLVRRWREQEMSAGSD